MQIIYKPKGKAGEYGKLACNIYLQCTHCCIYCYCPQILHIPKEEFFKIPIPRPNFLEKLEDDAKELKKKDIKKKIFLSFIGDPYQPIDEKFALTREAIKILHANNINVRILTKGGLRSMRDFDLLTRDDWYGATLTFLYEKASLQYEPGAAKPSERLIGLFKAHDRGIKTWVSLEPVIDPEQSFALIKISHYVVDEYKIGKLNYTKTDIDWKKFVKEAKTLLDSYGKKYYFKESLREFL